MEAWVGGVEGGDVRSCYNLILFLLKTNRICKLIL